MWAFFKKISIYSKLAILAVFLLFAVSISFAPKYQAGFLAMSKCTHCPIELKAKPVIGILLNSGGAEGYSRYPWYAIRKNYGHIISQHGGVPIFIGHDTNVLEEYVHLLDGLVLTGGEVELPEQVFQDGLELSALNPKYFPRAYLEYQLIQKAYAKNIPVLGICAGTQEMNVALGGTLIRDVQKALNSPITHHQENREQIQHQVNIAANSKLFSILQTAQLGVNSNHQAGLGKVAPALSMNAQASDGAIEGIEASNKRFFIGVIWHPEFVLSQQEDQLWQAFIEASRDYHRERVRHR